LSGEPSIDDLRWLLSSAAAQNIADAAADVGDVLRLSQRLRKTLSPQRSRLIVDQAVLRQKARAKFPNPEAMFFTSLGLQQSTDAFVAAYKASRFPAGAVADLCCGIGGDALAFAQRHSVVAVDRRLPTALIAQANLKASFAASASYCAVAADVAQFSLHGFDAWHIDPDRRSGGRRTTHVDAYQPSADVIDDLLRQNVNGAIKLAPASEIPADWAACAEQEWISRSGECKQLVAWFGVLTSDTGRRRATLLNAEGRLVASIAGELRDLSSVASEVGKFVYEPDAAVLASKLTGQIAETLELRPLTAGGGYLTGDQFVDHPALARYRVEAALPYRTSKLKSLLAARSIGRLEVKKRGVDLDPEQVRRELHVPGETHATLLLTRTGDRVMAMVTTREV
jgi:hypothetical protein